MRQFLHNAVERLKSAREGRTGIRYDITTTADGVQLRWLTPENETGGLTFRWAAVSAVDTYKRDCLIVDCICVAVETPDGGVELNEDMNGWEAFIDTVETHLPGFPARNQWWQKVAIPAFEANHRRLWRRSGTFPEYEQRRTATPKRSPAPALPATGDNRPDDRRRVSIFHTMLAILAVATFSVIP